MKRPNPMMQSPVNIISKPIASDMNSLRLSAIDHLRDILNERTDCSGPETPNLLHPICNGVTVFYGIAKPVRVPLIGLDKLPYSAEQARGHGFKAEDSNVSKSRSPTAAGASIFGNFQRRY